MGHLALGSQLGVDAGVGADDRCLRSGRQQAHLHAHIIGTCKDNPVLLFCESETSVTRTSR